MTMRRLLAIAGIAATAALVGVGAVAAPAGAGIESPEQQVFTCTFTLSTNELPAGGGPVQVSGIAPADTPVRIYVDNVLQATVQSSPTDGTWGPVTVTVTTSVDIRVSILADYPATPCLGPGGTEVERVTVAGASAALAKTGSNNTTTYVLVGATLLVTGLALAIAARRREYTHGRV